MNFSCELELFLSELAVLAHEIDADDELAILVLELWQNDLRPFLLVGQELSALLLALLLSCSLLLFERCLLGVLSINFFGVLLVVLKGLLQRSHGKSGLDAHGDGHIRA